MFDCEYLGGAVRVIRIVLFTGGQRDMSDRLHWVGQGEQHLALLAGDKKQNKWEKMQHGNPENSRNYSSILSFLPRKIRVILSRKPNKKHFSPRNSIHFSCKQHAAMLLIYLEDN